MSCYLFILFTITHFVFCHNLGDTLSIHICMCLFSYAYIWLAVYYLYINLKIFLNTITINAILIIVICTTFYISRLTGHPSIKEWRQLHPIDGWSLQSTQHPEDATCMGDILDVKLMQKIPTMPNNVKLYKYSWIKSWIKIQSTRSLCFYLKTLLIHWQRSYIGINDTWPKWDSCWFIGMLFRLLNVNMVPTCSVFIGSLTFVLFYLILYYKRCFNKKLYFFWFFPHFNYDLTTLVILVWAMLNVK